MSRKVAGTRPSIDRLREVLSYCRRTGTLIWKVNRGPVRVGDEAGSIDGNGYVQVGIDGHNIQAHVMIFAMETGRWPIRTIDHKDRNTTNNRWRNLREATESQNRGNSKVYCTNKIGLKGVRKYRDSFHSNINFQRRRIYLGTFSTARKAHAAYLAKAKELFGEFARGS